MLTRKINSYMCPFFTLQHYPGVGDIYKCVVGALSFLSIERIPSTADIFSAMMSGDSPNSHAKDYFDFKEGRSTPPPTTSKDVVVLNNSGEAKAEILAASVILEPLKQPCNNQLGVTDGGQPNHKNDDEIIAQEDKPLKSENLTDEGDRKKLNGTIDKLDGNWNPNSSTKKNEDDSDENCAVKCLYYTLQCCECNIM
ncbi:hypothetical protein FQR65_LT10483 [Abscondita terminalis]|nr:hypothetical protein FQR65_LT10483 [Abscondita terminalis]